MIIIPTTEFLKSLEESEIVALLEICNLISRDEYVDVKNKLAREMDLSDEEIDNLLNKVVKYMMEDFMIEDHMIEDHMLEDYIAKNNLES